MTSAVSGRSRKKARDFLVWPPSERGTHIPVCVSPLASYSVVVGLSEWALVDSRPWIYFRPDRRLKGRAFGEPFGKAERLTLFQGLNSHARRDAVRIFERICARLRVSSEKESLE